MPTRASKRRRDDEGVGSALRAIENVIGSDLAPKKNAHAVAMSKLGASKGGKARAAKLTPKKRSQIAKRAARARWGKKKG